MAMHNSTEHAITMQNAKHRGDLRERGMWVPVAQINRRCWTLRLWRASPLPVVRRSRVGHELNMFWNGSPFVSRCNICAPWFNSMQTGLSNFVRYYTPNSPQNLECFYYTPVTDRGGPWCCETSRPPRFLDNRLTDGDEVVSLRSRPPFTPQEDSLYSFLLEDQSTQGLHQLKNRVTSSGNESATFRIITCYFQQLSKWLTETLYAFLMS
jgi:hypothetical protein